MYIKPDGILLRWIEADPAYHNLRDGFEVDEQQVRSFEVEVVAHHPTETPEWQRQMAILYAATHPGFRSAVAPVINLETGETVKGDATVSRALLISVPPLTLIPKMLPIEPVRVTEIAPLSVKFPEVLEVEPLSGKFDLAPLQATATLELSEGTKWWIAHYLKRAVIWITIWIALLLLGILVPKLRAQPSGGGSGPGSQLTFKGLDSAGTVLFTRQTGLLQIKCGGNFLSCTWTAGTNTFFINPGAAAGTVTSITATAPIVVTPDPITVTGAISCLVASGAQAGCLSAANWTTFNAKVATSRSIATTSPLGGGGDLSADRTLTCTTCATTTNGGALSATSPVTISVAGVIAVPAATATVSGLVPTPPNNTTTYLRGDATFAAVPTLSVASLARTLVWQFYDGGTALTTASSALTYITAESACTINAWSISVDAGTATAKVWKVAAGTAIPTIANVINTSGVALSSGTHVRSTTVSDFTTTTITQGDVLTVVLTAAATATKLTFQLGCATVQ